MRVYCMRNGFDWIVKENRCKAMVFNHFFFNIGVLKCLHLNEDKIMTAAFLFIFFAFLLFCRNGHYPKSGHEPRKWTVHRGAEGCRQSRNGAGQHRPGYSVRLHWQRRGV